MKAMPFSFTVTPSFIMVPDGKGSWLSTGAGIINSGRLLQHTGCGTLNIPTGVHNNLASIPRPARLLFPVNAPHRVAAYVHDYLYEVRGHLPDGCVLSRKLCDDIFYDAMRATGADYLRSLTESEAIIRKALALMDNVEKPLVGSLTAGTMHRAVRIGGGFAWAT